MVRSVSVIQLRKGKDEPILVDLNGKVLGSGVVSERTWKRMRGAIRGLRGYVYSNGFVLHNFGGYVSHGYAVEYLDATALVFVPVDAGHAYQFDLDYGLSNYAKYVNETGIDDMMKEVKKDVENAGSSDGYYVFSTCARPPVVYAYLGAVGGVRKLIYSAVTHDDVVKLLWEKPTAITYCDKLVVSLPPSQVY